MLSKNKLTATKKGNRYSCLFLVPRTGIAILSFEGAEGLILLDVLTLIQVNFMFVCASYGAIYFAGTYIAINVIFVAKSLPRSTL